MCVLPAQIFVYNMSACDHRGQKKKINSLELELQMT